MRGAKTQTSTTTTRAQRKKQHRAPQNVGVVSADVLRSNPKQQRRQNNYRPSSKLRNLKLKDHHQFLTTIRDRIVPTITRVDNSSSQNTNYYLHFSLTETPFILQHLLVPCSRAGGTDTDGDVTSDVNQVPPSGTSAHMAARHHYG